MVEPLARFISQNFLWVREALLTTSFPVSCTMCDSTLSYNTSVSAHLGVVVAEGAGVIVCAALWALNQDWVNFLICYYAWSSRLFSKDDVYIFNIALF